jgi:hypothetical protein
MQLKSKLGNDICKYVICEYLMISKEKVKANYKEVLKELNFYIYLQPKCSICEEPIMGNKFIGSKENPFYYPSLKCHTNCMKNINSAVSRIFIKQNYFKRKRRNIRRRCKKLEKICIGYIERDLTEYLKNILHYGGKKIKLKKIEETIQYLKNKYKKNDKNI